MKHCIARLGLLAAIGLSGVACAQNVSVQFVVSGKAAEKIQDFSTINLATAQRIAETCERLVTAHGGGQHSISGVDGGQDENCAIEGLKAVFGHHATLPVYGPAGAGRGPAPAPGAPR